MYKWKQYSITVEWTAKIPKSLQHLTTEDFQTSLDTYCKDKLPKVIEYYHTELHKLWGN